MLCHAMCYISPRFIIIYHDNATIMTIIIIIDIIIPDLIC